MNNLKIKSTLKTPEIDFKAEEGVLKVKGRAIPENPEEFFSAVLQWVRDYFKNPNQVTQIDIQLEYINSGSSKYMLEFLHLLQKMHQDGRKCEINWYYEEDDESVLELGRHYQSIIDVPIKLIETY
jgi:hypothetical protein